MSERTKRVREVFNDELVQRDQWNTPSIMCYVKKFKLGEVVRVTVERLPAKRRSGANKK